MLLVLLVLLVAAPDGAASGAATCNRARIASCALTWMDLDHDGRISIAEMNNFTTYKPCGSTQTRVVGRDIIKPGVCDSNGDGYLSDADLDACVMYSEPLQRLICWQCDRCEEYNAV